MMATKPLPVAKLRHQTARPVLDRFKTRLETKQPIVPPKSLLSNAIDYALRNWPLLIVYVEDGRLTPENNAAENAIRHFVLALGGKTCLIDTPAPRPVGDG